MIDYSFPDVETADKDGLLAAGGDLSPDMLMSAYRRGIFPWFQQDEPVLWWSPDPRCVLFPNEIKVSKSMRNILNRGVFEVRYNTDFESVISHCKSVERQGQDGTWISNRMLQAYTTLHKLGYATSVEVYRDNKLAGGLYGVVVGDIFCGESMFSLESNASKVALITLAKNKNAPYRLIDCQMHTEHLESLGARNIPRHKFIQFMTNQSLLPQPHTQTNP
ncbi:MAG: leucyl/phenylalanyl-tRNA--protein transferase [Bacteroidales bacterium]